MRNRLRHGFTRLRPKVFSFDSIGIPFDLPVGSVGKSQRFMDRIERGPDWGGEGGSRGTIGRRKENRVTSRMAPSPALWESFERVFRACESGRENAKQLEEAASAFPSGCWERKRIVDVMATEALVTSTDAMRQRVSSGWMLAAYRREGRNEELELLPMLLEDLEEEFRRQKRKLKYALGLLELALEAPSQDLEQCCERFENSVCALVWNAVDETFTSIVSKYFLSKLTAFGNAFQRAHGLDQVETIEASTLKGEFLMGREWCDELKKVSESMRLLGLGAILEEQYGTVVNQVLLQEVSSYAKENFEMQALKVTKQWIEGVALPFFRVFVLSDEEICSWRSRLDYKIYRAVGEVREAAFFDIVVDFPESMGAVEDLKACLQMAHRHSQMIATATRIFAHRLLHAGAATSDILQTYISTIRVLQIVDPDGQLLHAIGDPICAYLRGRKDTIRCIVTMMTDDTPSEDGLPSLLEELASTDNEGGDGEGKEEVHAAEEDRGSVWVPARVTTASSYGTALPTLSDGSALPKDTVGFLIGIYGSKDLFVGEYRVMLAEKLLAKEDYDIEREVRTIELLKLRFGESALHNCEVMLKDFGDSKRIDSNIKSETNSGLELASSCDHLDSVILSECFWPGLQDEKVKLPPDIEGKLDLYARKYGALKAPRKLVWKHHLGIVNLDVDVGGSKISVRVNPPQAALLLAFREQREWGIDALSAKLGSTPPNTRRWALVWINSGVLQEIRNRNGRLVFKVSDKLVDEHRGDIDVMDADGGGISSMEEQLAQEMAVYESYIIGMLTNFDSLPLERIHNMLKMFVAEPPYDKTSEQLASFLGKLVAEDKLILEGSSYRRASK